MQRTRQAQIPWGVILKYPNRRVTDLKHNRAIVVDNQIVHFVRSAAGYVL